MSERKENKTSKEVNDASLDMDKFQEIVLDKYLAGEGDHGVPADELAARSLMPPLTASQRSFAFVAPDIPVYYPEKCIGCMECVVQCPDAAIHARALPEATMNEAIDSLEDEGLKEKIRANLAKPAKFWAVREKKGQTPATFSIWIDPDKCKGCGECVEVCASRGALEMVVKDDEIMDTMKKSMAFVNDTLPETPAEFINEKLMVDRFLDEKLWKYRGGAGACMGCGEVTAMKLVMTATAMVKGDNFAIVNATGCSSVYGATYPYAMWSVPWTNPLFENAATVAMGVRLRYDQTEKTDTCVWAVGGDGAMNDIGLQPVSRVLASGMNINVLVLDTQAYSNTGGQASTATYLGQNAKMSAHGRAIPGKTERRKEIGLLAMAHPDTYVAYVSASNYNHLMKTIIEAVEFDGPSLVVAYSPCMPEHGIADNAAFDRAAAAVESRAFPLFTYDPRKGDSYKERLKLQGNPSVKEDWHTDKKTGEVRDFIWFARQEGRFAKHFDKEGKPSESILASQDDRLKFWRQLKELAGVE